MKNMEVAIRNYVWLFLFGSSMILGLLLAFDTLSPSQMSAQAASEQQQMSLPTVITSSFYLEGTIGEVAPQQALPLTPMMGSTQANRDRDTTITSNLRPQMVEEVCVAEENRTGSFVIVSPSHFRHNFFTQADQFSFLPGLGYVYGKDSDSQVTLIAPVDLPDGATLTQYTIIYLDNFATTTDDLIKVGLYRKNLFNVTENNGMAEGMTLLNSGNSPTEVRIYCGFTSDFAGKTEFISNQYAYYLVLTFASGADLNQRLYGVRLDYQP